MEAINREILRAELSRDEGRRLKFYKDSRGFGTIGVGRNLDRRNADGTSGITATETATMHITRASCVQKGITDAQCDQLLDHDIDGTMADLDVHLPWWRRLDPVRQRVMVNMAFNMGIAVLMTFRNTLGAIANGRYDDAAHGMLTSKWASEVHDRARRLADLMRLGPATR